MSQAAANLWGRGERLEGSSCNMQCGRQAMAPQSSKALEVDVLIVRGQTESYLLACKIVLAVFRVFV